MSRRMTLSQVVDAATQNTPLRAQQKGTSTDTFSETINNSIDQRRDEDLALGLSLADVCSTQPLHTSVEALRQIRRRLKLHRYPNTQVRAIRLLDTLLRNAPNVAPACLKRETPVLAYVVKLASQKKKVSPLVQSEALRLIESSAKAFRRVLPLYEDTYLQMKRSGIDFPGVEGYPLPQPGRTHGRVVVQRANQYQQQPFYPGVGSGQYSGYPQQQHPQQQHPQQHFSGPAPGGSYPGYLGPGGIHPGIAAHPAVQSSRQPQPLSQPHLEPAPQQKDIGTVTLELRSQVELGSEMLDAASQKEDVATNDVLLDIIANCRRDQPLLCAHLESGKVSEKDLGRLLSLNDDITSFVKRFDARVMKEVSLESHEHRSSSTRDRTRRSTARDAKTSRRRTVSSDARADGADSPVHLPPSAPPLDAPQASSSSGPFYPDVSAMLFDFPVFDIDNSSKEAAATDSLANAFKAMPLDDGSSDRVSSNNGWASFDSLPVQSSQPSEPTNAGHEVGAVLSDAGTVAPGDFDFNPFAGDLSSLHGSPSPPTDPFELSTNSRNHPGDFNPFAAPLSPTMSLTQPHQQEQQSQQQQTFDFFS